MSNIATSGQVNVEIVQFVQKFEREFAEAQQLLRKSQTLSVTEAGNISLRVPGESRLVIASLNGQGSGIGGVVDFDLNSHIGTLTPSLKEVAALHIAILRERPDANAVIHSHSPYLTAWSIAGRALPVRYATLLGNGTDDIPLAAWGARYAEQPVIDVLRKHPKAKATLLANHGPFAWADSVLNAARQLVFLEEAAYFTHLAEQIGGAKELPPGAFEAVELGRKKFYAA
jgi:L-ribulose-5-phosphate 4-epimerase